jgi:hypothetical protein
MGLFPVLFARSGTAMAVDSSVIFHKGRKTTILGGDLKSRLMADRWNERRTQRLFWAPIAAQFGSPRPLKRPLTMDLNRHQFFFIGLFVLLIGLQFRYVQAYVLNPQTTKFLAEHTGKITPAASAMFDATGTAPRKVVQPPEWLSWCLLSVGAVLALHSLAMPKPA